MQTNGTLRWSDFVPGRPENLDNSANVRKNGEMWFIEQFREQGWLKFGGMFERAFIDDLHREYRRQYETLAASPHRQLGPSRLQLSVKLTGPFLDSRLYANPLLLGILSQLLGDDLLIDSLNCITSLPGAADQAPHRDHPKLFPEASNLNHQLMPFGVLVAIPLIDLTPESGTTKIFLGIQRDAKVNRSETPYLARGDCFLMDYRTKHLGTANCSSEERPIIYIAYTRPWFTDENNFSYQERILVDLADLRKIQLEHLPLFRRLATKGGLNISKEQLFNER